MFEYVRDLWWNLQFPWPRSTIKNLQSLKVSVCPTHRLSECERLYEQNIAYGLPQDHLPKYSEILRSKQHLVLIAEQAETLVGTFTLTRHSDRPLIWLCYVLVEPNHHRRGVGTTMFFASLAMLPEATGNEVMAITSLPPATAFYKRLGFLHAVDVREVDGQMIQVSVLPILDGMNKACRKWLANAGVGLKALGSEIPASTEPPSGASQIPAASS